MLLGEFEKRISENGFVKVGEPYETGWYEKEGYKDDDDFYVVDELVMIKKEDIQKWLAEAKREFPMLYEQPMLSVLRYRWFKKWFGDEK